MFLIYEKYFKDNRLINNLPDYYSKKQNMTLDVRRNFYLNENFSSFEEEIAELSKEHNYVSSLYIQIDKVIIFIISVILII